ncbi:MAG TPA: hypothetical protein VGT08_13430 [Terracidiphilus sp.]|nr:hypothetical protein [Terracidiphilus sp.]
MADCVGHSKVSVSENTLTVDIWCTGTCTNGACRAVWITDGDIGVLHFRNGYASEEEPGVVHQIRQYEIRDTVEHPKIQFSCDCGDTSRKFAVEIERIERVLSAGEELRDVIFKIVEIILPIIPLVLRLFFSKKKPSSHEVASTVQAIGEELGKAEKTK